MAAKFAAVLLLPGQVAGAYDESEALVYANLVTAAYCGVPKTTDNSLLEAWQCGPACDAVTGMSDVRAIDAQAANDAHAFVGKLNGECILSFRGTSDLSGWISDLKSLNLVDITAQGVACSYQGTACQVGKGFMDNYNSVASFIKGNLSAIGCTASKPLSVTGHSLGAAEAAIAMFDLKNQGYTIAKTYTFGQPRVGDATFASAFEHEFGSAEPWRLTHAEDPIPHLPLEGQGFRHLSTEIYYAGDVSGGYKKCDGSGEDQSCANSRSSDLPIAILECADANTCAHLSYMTKLKTTLMDGSSCAGTTTVV